MITLWKKPTSKNVAFDICNLAEASIISAVNKDTVEISFTSGTVNRSSDFILSISSDSRKTVLLLLIEALVNGRPKNITEYTVDELTEALKTKLKMEDD